MLAVRNNSFSQRAVRQWHSCPGSGGVTVEVSQSHGDVALRDVVGGDNGMGLDWMILVVFSSLNASMIYTEHSHCTPLLVATEP
mgnify:FL=1